MRPSVKTHRKTPNLFTREAALRSPRSESGRD